MTVVLVAYVIGAEWGHIALLGFPDGHRTDYDRAQIALLRTSFIPALGVAFVATFLAVRGRVRRGQLATLAVIAGLLFATVYALDRRNYATMDHGQGG